MTLFKKSTRQRREQPMCGRMVAWTLPPHLRGRLEEAHGAAKKRAEKDAGKGEAERNFSRAIQSEETFALVVLDRALEDLLERYRQEEQASTLVQPAVPKIIVPGRK